MFFKPVVAFVVLGSVCGVPPRRVSSVPLRRDGRYIYSASQQTEELKLPHSIVNKISTECSSRPHNCCVSEFSCEFRGPFVMLVHISTSILLPKKQ
jgi:hypothetical protein